MVQKHLNIKECRYLKKNYLGKSYICEKKQAGLQLQRSCTDHIYTNYNEEVTVNAIC